MRVTHRLNEIIENKEISAFSDDVLVLVLLARDRDSHVGRE